MENENPHEEVIKQCKLATDAFEAGDIDKAIRMLFSAIDQWPNFYALYNNLGCIYQIQYA